MQDWLELDYSPFHRVNADGNSVMPKKQKPMRSPKRPLGSARLFAEGAGAANKENLTTKIIPDRSILFGFARCITGNTISNSDANLPASHKRNPNKGLDMQASTVRLLA